MQCKDARIGRLVCLFVALVALTAFVVGFTDTVSARDSVVLRFGGKVVVGPEERRFGEVMVVGGTIEIDGQVSGEVVSVGGTLRLDGVVDGDVVVIGGSAALGPEARVTGTLTAVGSTIDRHPEAMVRGDISVFTIGESIRFGFWDWDGIGWRPFGWRWYGWHWFWSLLNVAGLLALSLLLHAIIPNNVDAVAEHMQSNGGRSIVIGLLTVLLLVPLTLVLLLTIVGPLLLWLGFAAAMMVGYVALVTTVGNVVTERFATNVTPLLAVVTGVLVLAVLRYVPLFGSLFILLATIWSVGAVLDTKFGTNRPWLPPRQA